ncbi:melanocortin-2 receptor accessory protein 2A-like [Aulostomus maculatus]
MSDLHNRSQSSARRSDYVWQYEYYDDDEPVSFEGLKAHRYSIVIGFWVGLAVFVIFMFFVLTLLTKTGAPHQENSDSAEKHHRPGSCLVDADGLRGENDKAFSLPLLTESCAYFNFYINEEGPNKRNLKDNRNLKQTGWCQAQLGTLDRPGGISSAAMDEVEEDVEGNLPLGGLTEERKTQRECAFLSHFNIPNFVNLEHRSSLGEDDLLYEPPVILERQPYSKERHSDTS